MMHTLETHLYYHQAPAKPAFAADDSQSEPKFKAEQPKKIELVYLTCGLRNNRVFSAEKD